MIDAAQLAGLFAQVPGQEIKLFNGQTISIQDWISASMYSAVSISENLLSTTIRLFDYGLSEELPGNKVRAGILRVPAAVTLHRLQILNQFGTECRMEARVVSMALMFEGAKSFKHLLERKPHDCRQKLLAACKGIPQLNVLAFKSHRECAS